MVHSDATPLPCPAHAHPLAQRQLDVVLAQRLAQLASYSSRAASCSSETSIMPRARRRATSEVGLRRPSGGATGVSERGEEREKAGGLRTSSSSTSSPPCLMPAPCPHPLCLPEQLRHQTVDLCDERPTLVLQPRRLVRLPHRRNVRAAAWRKAELLLDLGHLFGQSHFPGAGGAASSGRLLGRSAGIGS